MGKTETVTFQAEITAHFDIPAGIWQDYAHFYIWCLDFGGLLCNSNLNSELKDMNSLAIPSSTLIYNLAIVSRTKWYKGGSHRQALLHGDGKI